MQNWRSPWWILLTGVFPTGALLALATQIFYIISPQLKANSLMAWTGLGVGLLLMLLGQLIYFLYLRWQGKESHLFFHLAVYFSTFFWFYAFALNVEKLVPSDIPAWMVGEESFLYPVGLLMPNLAYSLFFVIAHLTNFEKTPKIWENLLGAGAVTLLSYLGINLLSLRIIPETYLPHVAIVGLFSASTLFFFFLGRSMFIFGHRPWSGWTKWDLLIKGILGIVFPLWGLILNNNGRDYYLPDKIFGDFTSPWFYILAIANGILFTLPNFPQPLYRLILFVLRSALFSYILYFALVFLPFMPLAIPAILAIGTGFLMLTPIVLLVLQTGAWMKDLAYLRAYFPKLGMIAAAILVSAVIPGVLYFSALKDRSTLHQALDYVYTPDLGHPESFQIEDKRLQRVIQHIYQNKSRRNAGPSNGTTPYLSHFYNSIVLDNLTLSDRKLNRMEAIFFGKELKYFPEEITRRSVPQIKNAQVESKWDETDQSWRSTLNIDIENPGNSQEEYRSVFSLPDGALIQDYYLYVGQEKVKGDLAEKKAATWIYQQIVNNSRRDPGLLSYLDSRTLSLRVYPFQAKEVRKTGFTVIHKEAFTLKLDGRELAFGDDTHNQNLTAPIILGNGQLAYVPNATKATLPRVILEPHYHFIVDCSVSSKKHTETLIKNIEQLLQSRKYPADVLHFHLTNREVLSLKSNKNWQDAIRNRAKVGGFFAERAFEQILYDYASNPLQHYPVMVLVSAPTRLPVMPEFSPRLGHHVYNGMRYCYLQDNLLETTGFRGKLENTEIAQVPIEAVAYPNAQKPLAYLTGSPLISLSLKPLNATLKKNTWESAALFQSEWKYLEAHPQAEENNWLQTVQKSFATGFLCPETAYMVLENESQRRMLKVKQRQVLQGKKALDAGEDPVRMSEPGLWVLVGLLLFFVMYRKFSGY